MRLRIASTLGAAVMLAGASLSAPAGAQGSVSGELRDIKGSVMVLKGKDYVNASTGMAVTVGDRILVLEKAQARVVVTTGGQRCEIDLHENQALTITAIDCKALTAAVQTVPGAGAPGSAAVAAGAAGTAGAAGGGTAGAAGAGGGGAGFGAAIGGGVAFGTAAAVSGGVFLGVRNKASGD